MRADTPLEIVDTTGPGWQEKTTEVADTGRNFILVLSTPEDLIVVRALLGSPHYIPEQLDKPGLLALTDAIKPKYFPALVKAQTEYPIHFVEQLRLPRNRPPRCQLYLLYCEVHGIISEHATIQETAAHLIDELEHWDSTRTLPLIGIYKFEKGQWHRQKGVLQPSIEQD